MRIVIKPLGALVLLALALTLATLLLNLVRNHRKGTLERRSDVFLVVGDSGKRAWLQDRLYRYNIARASAKPVSVLLRDSRAADQSDQSDTKGMEPSRLWMYSGTGWSAIESGENAPRPLFVTPLVLVTTKQKAAFLRPLLTAPPANGSTFTVLAGEQGVGNREQRAGNPAASGNFAGEIIPDLGLSPTAPRSPLPVPARLTFTHADPALTADGMYVRGLLLADFAARTKQTPEKAVADPAFRAFVQRLYRRFAPADPALAAEPTALARAFARDPSRADILICAESDALIAVRENANLVVLTPHPTTLISHSATLVHAERLTPTARQTADDLLAAFSTDDAIADALRTGFRRPDGKRSPALNRYATHGFAPVVSGTRSLPPYRSMEKASEL